ncbi:MAG: DUF4397 domain-containing protein [Gemmatimonadales bacterium]
MSKYRFGAALLGVALLGACDKNAVQDITGPLAASRVRFFHFGVNAPQVNFYANDDKVTAISSTTGNESTVGTGYGSVGAGGAYSAVDPGQYSFTGRIAATTDKDLVIATVASNIDAGKFYSVYLSGFYNTTAKSSDGFIVEDPIPEDFDWSQAYVRFVNAIGNSNPMTLYAKNTVTQQEVPLGAAVAYKNAGAFTALPPGSYDLGARVAGASTNAVARTGVGFAAGRVYTIGARGDITVTSTTATNRPFLDNTTNR